MDLNLSDLVKHQNYRISNNLGINIELCQNIHYQIALGIKFLHDNNYTHRDIHPPNIILKKLDDENKFLVKIGDFGLSSDQITGENKENRTVCGNREYIAPEVSTGNYNDQCDLYSIGRILDFMICGNSSHQFKPRDYNDIFEDDKRYKEVIDLIEKLIVIQELRLNYNEYLRHPFIFPNKVGKYHVNVFDTLDKSIIDKYTLSKDSYGCIKSCYDDNGNKYAIKKILITDRDRIMREIDIWKSLHHHQNIVQINECIVCIIINE